MAGPTITLACQAYDRTLPILRGLVQPRGFELSVEEMDNVPTMFARMHAGDFDASEMSLAEMVYAISRGESDLIGVPIFPSRVFRHSYIYCGSSSDLKELSDLDGKRVAFPRLVQTASIWQRGVLTEDHGVSPASTEFLYASIHHWDQDVDEGITPRDGSGTPSVWRPGNANKAMPAEQAVADGEIEAVATTVPHTRMPSQERVRRVLDDYQQAEIDYFRRTRIFPIMHMVAVKREMAERHPELPQALFEMFVEAKQRANDWLKREPSLSLAWKGRYMEEEREVFDSDPWAYGLEANRHVVDKFLGYCYDQGISTRPMEAQELFLPGTWDFEE
ncbi:MAG: PhnD/SsuA/transferrin family substrate-binding protein [Dehalococcoidia bacterium]